MLAPLSRLAGKYDVTVLCVSHLNKSAGTNAMYRTMESLAFVAAVRSAWCVTKDKDDPLRRLMLPIKVNLCREPTGMAYSVVSAPMDPSVGMVRWEPEPIAGVDVDEALAPVRERKTSVLEATTEWLEAQLANGPLVMREVERRAIEADYSWASVRRAQYLLGIKPRKSGFAEGWLWELRSPRCSDPQTHTNELLGPTESKTAITSNGLSTLADGSAPNGEAQQYRAQETAAKTLNQNTEPPITESKSEDAHLCVSETSNTFGASDRSQVSPVDAFWAELANMPPAVLRDRASRTDDPETKRRLLDLARKKRKGDNSDRAGREAIQAVEAEGEA